MAFELPTGPVTIGTISKDSRPIALVRTDTNMILRRFAGTELEQAHADAELFVKHHAYDVAIITETVVVECARIVHHDREDHE
jgi:hypothetical protein